MNTAEDDFSTGALHVDAHHRQLILLATRARLKIDSTPNLTEGEIRQLLLDFAATARRYFAIQERLLAALDHPGLQAHIATHAALTQALLDCVERIDTGGVTHAELSVLLEDRLIRHILVEDARLTPFLVATSQTAHPGQA